MSHATSHPFVSPLKRAAVAAAMVLGIATTAQSAQRDYYVHFSAYNPNNGVSGNYVTASITPDNPGGQPLQRPAGACGMRFENVDDTAWLTPIPYAPDFNGSINVWLPSKDCGAWNTVVIERDNVNGQVSQPSGVAGSLRVEGAAAYWIDSGGHKLVYKNKPCVKNGVNKCTANVGLTKK